MPIYMDRHDVSEEITAAHIAHLHQQDLNIQDKYNCKALTYWFDEARQTAFCLVDAPNKEAMIAMHNDAHGKIPTEIIEVEKTIVESFLGRIGDPEKAINTELNIINDPAFRAIVLMQPNTRLVNPTHSAEIKQLLTNEKNHLQKYVGANNGRIVRCAFNEILLSFTTVSDALSFAISIKKHINKSAFFIGISAGIPVTEQNGFFESAIADASRMCVINTDKIVVSTEVNDLYESELLNEPLNLERFRILLRSEKLFLKKLFEFVGQEFNSDTLLSSNFHQPLGMSKSQFYRLITGILNISPNQFLKEYRLQKSIDLLLSTEKNISEIAFLVGFKSQSQFSKSFQKHFGLSPTNFRVSTR